MTYNVHGCVGLDWQRSEKRIAEVIARFEPDVIALQELDRGRRRSRGLDQTAIIAQELSMQFHFHPAMKTADEEYGDAILSRWPLRLVKGGALPAERPFLFRETRGALWVEIATPEGKLHVINTHFGLGGRERHAQAAALLGPDWIGAVPAREPLVVCGDFNSLFESRVYMRFASALTPAVSVSEGKSIATFPTALPFLTLDHLFGNARLHFDCASVARSQLAVIASDHFPLTAEAQILEATDTSVAANRSELGCITTR